MATLSPSIYELRYVGGDPIAVVAEGQFDLTSTPDLDALVRHALVQRKADVVVDLAGVTYAGSELINALVELLADSRHTGTALRLRGTPGHVTRLLQAAGVTDLFDYS